MSAVSVIEKVHVCRLPLASCAVRVTVVGLVKVVPTAGDCVIAGLVSQLSVMVACAVYSGMGSPILSVLFVGQLMTGFSVSAAFVSVNVQDDLLPDASSARIVMVIPFTKALPAAGDCVTMGLRSLLSETVTVGM